MKLANTVKKWATALVAVGYLVISGCGGGGSSEPPAQQVSIEATTPELTPTPTTTPTPQNIVAWGDSLTEGGGAKNSFPAFLAVELGRTVVNFGLGVQDAGRVLVRQGGRPIVVTADGNAMPSSGAVNITPSIRALDTSGTIATLKGTVVGIAGTMSKSGSQYVFTRATPGSIANVPVDSLFVVDNSQTEEFLPVFWIGRNHFNYSQSAAALDIQVSTVLSAISDAVAHIKTKKTRFIILGVSSGQNTFEYLGTNNYQTKRNLAQALATAYPDNFVDIDQILVNSFDPTNSQDLIDNSNGITPTSLRSDTQHFNNAGYTIVAKEVAKVITARGW